MMSAKRKIRTFISVLMLLFMVTNIVGCGADEKQNTDQTAKEDQAEKEDSDQEHEKAVKVEDGTMSENSTVIAVGQTPVTLSLIHI